MITMAPAAEEARGRAGGGGGSIEDVTFGIHIGDKSEEYVASSLISAMAAVGRIVRQEFLLLVLVPTYICT